jgi:hypothetical protein
MQQYLRVKNRNSSSPHISIHNSYWAVRGANEDYNEGQCTLTVTGDIYGVQSDWQSKINELMGKQNGQ